MNHKPTKPLTKQQIASKVIAKALLSQAVENDCFVIDDHRLQAVATGQSRFTADERLKVLQSPQTMKRLRWLDIQYRKNKQNTQTITEQVNQQQMTQQPSELIAKQQAANDESFAVLRAAAGHGDEFVIESEDARYTLHFLPPLRGRYRVKVCCSEQWLQSLRDKKPVVKLETNDGLLIFQEPLDEYGEMSGFWSLPLSPREYLSQTGNSLKLSVVD